MALFDTLLAGDKTPSPQGQSALLNLPAEIRNQIYNYTYPRHFLHIKRKFSRHYSETLPFVAFCCVELGNERHVHMHRACPWMETSRKHMLSLPLTCKQLYLEGMPKLYQRHRFHFQDDTQAVLWASRIPAIHYSAMRSIQITLLEFDPDAIGPYEATWKLIASLPSLKEIRVFIADCELPEVWEDADLLDRLAGPMKTVKQPSVEHFDVIFNIGSTWFPDDCYMKISYNRLHWDTFTMETDGLSAFTGLHPACRMIGMNGFVVNRPVRDDMPSQSQLIGWFNWFSCNAAYGEDEPEGYDYRAMGELAAASKQKEDSLAKKRARDREEGKRLRDVLQEKCMYGEDADNDPDHWDLQMIHDAALLMEPNPVAHELGDWFYPEKPSWVKDGDAVL